MRMVMESRRETRKVMSTPKTMTPVRIRVDRREFSGETAVPTKNMEIIARMVGNRASHGMGNKFLFYIKNTAHFL